MQSAPSSHESDPNEIIPENEELVGYVYKRVVREVLARIDQRLAELEKHGPDNGEARRSAANGRRGLFGRWAVRGALGLLLVVGVVGAAAAAWYWTDNDSARNFVARWAPTGLVATRDSQTPPKDGPEASTELSTRGAPEAATEVAPGPPASAPQDATDNDGRETVGTVGRSAAPVSPDLAPLIQKMAHDIANLGQGIEQLRMSQDQMSRDNATAVQQLQASQDQLVRLVKTPVQSPQPKTSPPPRTTTATRPPRRPQSQQPTGFLFRRAT
jgi:hypothetical protein